MRAAAIVLAVLLAGPGPARAQDDAGAAGDGAHEKVVVTASRHAEKITEAPAAVTVITADEIAASGAVNLADVLRRVPGLDFMQVSARDYEVNVRGFDNLLSRRLLVLVDGRSVYVDVLGFVLWDGIALNLDDVERIEVVRGPGSAPYGANASSGVVNIITKQPKDIDGVRLRAAYGEGRTIDTALLAGGQPGRLGYKVSAQYFQTDPFPNPDRPAQGGDGPATRQPRGSFRLQGDVGGGAWLLDGGYAATQGILYTQLGPLDLESGSYSPFLRTSYSDDSAGGGRLFLQGFWNGGVGRTLNLTSLQENEYHTDSYDVEGQWDHEVGTRQQLVVGANVRVTHIHTDLIGRDRRETIAGVYAQDQIRLWPKVTADLALRIDHDPLNGTLLAPKAGLLWSPVEGHTLRAVAATAYNSSTYLESYLDVDVTPIPSNPSFTVHAQGDPDLDPEKIASYEIGYRALLGSRALVDVALFHARLQDFVQLAATDFYAPGVPKAYSFRNGAAAVEDGAELEAEVSLPRHLALLASAAWLDVDAAPSITDVFARHKAAVSLQYRGAARFTGGIGVHYADRIDFPPSTTFYRAGTVPAYTLVDGMARLALRRDGSLSVAVRGTNLLDHEHREFIAGDVIGRRVLVEVAWRR